jgi:hypothetical protein
MTASGSKRRENHLEEEKQSDETNEGNNNGKAERGLTRLQADRPEEESGNPDVRPPDHFCFGEAIKEQSVYDYEDRDARDKDVL